MRHQSSNKRPVATLKQQKSKRPSLKSLHFDFEKRGVIAIEELREKNPTEYVKLVGKVVRPVMRGMK